MPRLELFGKGLGTLTFNGQKYSIEDAFVEEDLWHVIGDDNYDLNLWEDENGRHGSIYPVKANGQTDTSVDGIEVEIIFN